MKINQLTPPPHTQGALKGTPIHAPVPTTTNSAGQPPDRAWNFGRIKPFALSIVMIFMVFGEVKAQLQTYLNGATPATTFQSIEDKMLPYLDSLKFVTDVQGRLVVSFRLSGNRGQQLIDTRTWIAGQYIYTLNVAGFTQSGKLVVVK